MSNLFYQEILEKQEKQLKQIYLENEDPVLVLKASLSCVQENLTVLKLHVASNPLKDIDEEIHFFKNIKPEIYSWKIYCVERFNLEKAVMVGTNEMRSKFWEDELCYVERFFSKNSFYFEYYRQKMDDLDQQLFTRDQSMQLHSIESPETDPAFSTSMDYLFAKFKALERLKLFIGTKIMEVLNGNSQPSESKATSTLNWTGEAINLVEIAYGIWLTGQVNNGNAEISDIIRQLESFFNVNIGRAYRRWTEIAQRKRNSYTKQLDKMRGAIIERINNELELK